MNTSRRSGPAAARPLTHDPTMKTPPAPCARACRPALGLALACLALALAAPPRAAAQATPNPPERLTYQGFLTDGNGVALGNTAPKNYDVIFRIWNSENQSQPANLLWAEQQTVTVDKGYFSVLLGEGASTGEPRPALSTLFKGATASDRWVGITVKGIGAGGANVDILPRLRLLSAPYAFLAQQANRLVQDNGNDLISASGTAVTVSGSLQVLNALTANSFSGDGTGLAGVAKLNGGNTFSGGQIINGPAAIQGANTLEFGFGVAGKNGDAGKIGYGTWQANALNIVGAGTASNNRRVYVYAEGGTDFAGGIRVRGGPPGGVGVNNNGYAFSGNGGDNDSGMFSSGDGQVEFYSNAGERMRIHSNGAVGIGTTAPDRTLHVNGTVGVSFNNALEFGRGYTKEQSAGQIGYGTHSGGAGGSLDIVGAGTAGNNRKITMWAEGGLKLNGYFQVYGRSSLYSWGLRSQLNDSQYFELWRNNQGIRFDVFGPMGNTSATIRSVTYDGDSNWDFGSDRRLKKDIEDAEPVLDRVLQVQVRRYRWKDEDEAAKHKLGVIAQEVQPLFPDLVGESTNRDGTETHLTVGYSDFGLLAVKALQEFKAKHDAEVGELRSEVAELKAQVALMLRANAELQERLEKETLTASTRR